MVRKKSGALLDRGLGLRWATRPIDCLTQFSWQHEGSPIPDQFRVFQSGFFDNIEAKSRVMSPQLLPRQPGYPILSLFHNERP